MKFICLGYLDPAQFALIPESEQAAWMEECFAYDEELMRGGYHLGGEALTPANTAVTVRPRQGKAVVTDGPFAETKEFIGGILIIEARDLNHAIALMSKHPGVRAGGFEIRASDPTIEAIFEARKLPTSPKE
jgi:hypothetical protein